ncbi:hypothetical protein DSM100685_0695 [Bifidobacterium avesanii]|nr:hypothetical protein DSM100685_0695 [Bifidobacterium avesanii]
MVRTVSGRARQTPAERADVNERDPRTGMFGRVATTTVDNRRVRGRTWRRRHPARVALPRCAHATCLIPRTAQRSLDVSAIFARGSAFGSMDPRRSVGQSVPAYRSVSGRYNSRRSVGLHARFRITSILFPSSTIRPGAVPCRSDMFYAIREPSTYGSISRRYYFGRTTDQTQRKEGEGTGGRTTPGGPSDSGANIADRSGGRAGIGSGTATDERKYAAPQSAAHNRLLRAGRWAMPARRRRIRRPNPRTGTGPTHGPDHRPTTRRYSSDEPPPFSPV